MSTAGTWSILLLAFVVACDDTARAVEEQTRDERAKLERKTEKAGHDIEEGARKATEVVKNVALNAADAAAHAVDRVDKDIANTVRGNEPKPAEEPR